MKHIKRILVVLIITAFFLIEWKIADYVLVDNAKSYTRITSHEFYNQDNIDVLFLGTSHVYRSLDPKIADELFGKNTFNAGSSSQPLDVTYALLKEAISLYDLKQVYLDLSYNNACSFNMKDRNNTNMTGVYAVSDYMRFSKNKVDLLLNASDSEYYNNIFPLLRGSWKNIDHVGNIILSKQNSAYDSFQYVTSYDGKYVGKGFVVGEDIIPEGSFYTKDSDEKVGVDKISEDWNTYLKNIVNLCRENNIEITFFCTPVSTYLLDCWGNYDEYIKYVNSVASDMNVEFHDYNLCKEQYWEDTSTLFFDTNHLNKNGAEKFTKLFCDVETGKMDISQIFYSSVKDKIGNSVQPVYGVNYKDYAITSDTKKREARIVSGGLADCEYKIEVIDEKENITKVIQEFSDNKEFEVPLKNADICHITYRDEDGTEGFVDIVLNETKKKE